MVRGYVFVVESVEIDALVVVVVVVLVVVDDVVVVVVVPQFWVKPFSIFKH